MVSAPGGQGGRFPLKRAADFLEPQQIPVKGERAIQVFHVKHHMPQVLRLHPACRRSRAARSHRLRLAAASYVLCKKASRTESGDGAVRTVSYGNINSLIARL